MKTPGHKLALQAETRNQRLRFPQRIQELEKSPNSGRFPDFLNPATRSERAPKVQSPASTIRNTRRTSSAPRHETTLPLRGFPVCLSNSPADRSMRSASLRANARAEGLLLASGRKAAPFAWGLSRLQGGLGEREASKRKGPLEEGYRFSRGRAAESNRPRVGRRDCPFVPLCRRPSRT